MRVSHLLQLAVLLAVSAAFANTACGQMPPQYQPMPQYQPAGYAPSVTISESMYTDLLRRLEALEGKPAGFGADGRKEVEVLTKPTQKWSGRVHFDYWPFPNNNDPLANFLEEGNPAVGPRDFVGFRRLRFGVAGDVTENMLYKIEMEFADPDALSFKDAYLGWDELAFFQTVLLGNQKRPYGLDHLNSSRYNVFLERPLVVEAFNQDARRLGLQAYGVSDDERWNWRSGVFLMEDLARFGGQRSDNYQSEIAGRLANTIWYDETSGGRGYAHWAIAGSAAFPGTGTAGRFRTRPEARTRNRWFDTGNLNADRYQLIALEGVLNIGAFSLVGEYMYADVQQRGGNSVNFGGGYIYAAYWLTGEHTPWSRSRGTLGRTKPLENFFWVPTCDGERALGWGAWQIAARYSHGDFTDDAVFGGVGNTFTAGLNWWWNPYARVQFNYIYGDIADRVVADAPTTNGHYHLLGSRFMVDF